MGAEEEWAPEEFFTESQQSVAKAEALKMSLRLVSITGWLKESGSNPEALMLGYFNECMNVATKSRGVTGAYVMANQLHWHVVQLVRKLHAASQSKECVERPAKQLGLKPLEDFFTEAQKWLLQSDCYDLALRFFSITDWLRESGSSPEALMLGYFNECMRLATASRGVAGAYILASQLHWHVAQLIGKLQAASGAVNLAELPADPTVKTSDPEQQ
jgi:hypothetical protein